MQKKKKAAACRAMRGAGGNRRRFYWVFSGMQLRPILGKRGSVRDCKISVRRWLLSWHR